MANISQARKLADSFLEDILSTMEKETIENLPKEGEKLLYLLENRKA